MRVEDEDDCDHLVTKLIDAAATLDENEGVDMRLLVSCGMPHGWGYSGYLAEKTWKAVEARSE